MSNILDLDKKNIKICNKFTSRLIGMAFKKKKSNIIYFFPKCNSIHTFFMFKSIDVLMTDKNNNIIKKYINLKPWKIILPKKNVVNVYEIEHNLIKNIENIKKINLI